MKKIYLILVISILSSLSTYAQFRFNAGSLYMNRQSIQRQCDRPRWSFDRCTQVCDVAVWYSYYGTDWGYVQVWNGFRSVWVQRQMTRRWWYYEWDTRVFRCF